MCVCAWVPLNCADAPDGGDARRNQEQEFGRPDAAVGRGVQGGRGEAEEGKALQQPEVAAVRRRADGQRHDWHLLEDGEEALKQGDDARFDIFDEEEQEYQVLCHTRNSKKTMNVGF